MIKKVFQSILQILGIAILSFVILELAAGILGSAPGASNFVEAHVIRHGLRTQKPADEIRIFAYGESTMHGAHYAPVSNPARWLEEYLKDFLPDKKIKVVNFARMGKGIHFSLETFKSTLVYRPDVAIFYMGHNDFFPDERMDQLPDHKEPLKYYFRRLILKSHFISFLNRLLIRVRMNRDKASSEDRMGHEIIETPLSDLKGASPTPRSEPFFWMNIEFFDRMLNRIVDLGNRHDVPLLFLEPVSNIKDFAPFQSIHMTVLTPNELAAWDSFFEEGKRLEEKNQKAQALESYEKAYQIDPTYAELCFRMGRLYFDEKNYSRARRLLEHARDFDAIVLRATKEILEFYHGLARQKKINVIQTEKVFEPKLEGGIPGEPLFEDNVHFSIKGQALAGRALAQEIAEQGWIAPVAQWHFEKERSFEVIGQSLGIRNDLLASAYVRISQYYASRFTQRITYAQKALTLDPEGPDALRSLAWAYWLSNQKEKARTVYQKLGTTYPAIFQEIVQRLPELRDVTTPSS